MLAGCVVAVLEEALKISCRAAGSLLKMLATSAWVSVGFSSSNFFKTVGGILDSKTFGSTVPVFDWTVMVC